MCKQIFIPILFFSFISCKEQPHFTQNVPYHFENYDTKYELPKTLNEISGIAFLATDEFLVQNDEEGFLFVYDLKENKITKEIKFAKNADYEDVAVVDSAAFVLQSNGTIFEINHFLTQPKVTKHHTFLTQKDDVEGLCAFGNQQLLVTTKGKNHHQLFPFSLETKKLAEKPIFEIDKKELEEKYKIKSRILPSAIAQNPLNQSIYILSSVSKVLLQLDKNGKLIAVFNINFPHFPQPEGMCFDKNGTLYISNEAKSGKKPTILKFNPVK